MANTSRERFSLAAAALAALLVLGVSCGSSSESTYHCSSMGTSTSRCMEFSNVITTNEMTADQATCGTGTLATGTCPRTGILGGCLVEPNQVEWYYPGGNLAAATDVMTLCSTMGLTFVAAPTG